MLKLYNFPPMFINWIMGCITGSWFSIKINGGVSGFFTGKSGVRQGDPLSPFIFVMGMEILSRLFRNITTYKGFAFHPKCVRLKLTHLIFADDLMVFVRGDLPSVMAVKSILHQFAAFSGLNANAEKTEIYFGGGV